MPERLAGAVQQFTDDVGRLHTPLAVLVALQNLSHGMLKARRTSAPFTFTETERDGSASQTNWIFGFLRSYNMRDGLYCTYRAWAAVFVSTKIVVLRPSQRAFLAAVAQGAIGPIEDIVNSRRKRRRGKKVNTFDLTARELEVLQRRALLGSNAAIAKALDISIQTVDVHLRSARRKLKVEDTAIALLESYKRGLIEY